MVPSGRATLTALWSPVGSTSKNRGVNDRSPFWMMGELWWTLTDVCVSLDCVVRSCRYGVVLFTSLSLRDDLVDGEKSLVSRTSFYPAIELTNDPGTRFLFDMKKTNNCMCACVCVCWLIFLKRSKKTLILEKKIFYLFVCVWEQLRIWYIYLYLFILLCVIPRYTHNDFYFTYFMLRAFRFKFLLIVFVSLLSYWFGIFRIKL